MGYSGASAGRARGLMADETEKQSEQPARPDARRPRDRLARRLITRLPELIERIEALEHVRTLPSEIRRVVSLSVLGCAFLTVTWALTGGGYFWPAWPWLAIATFVAVWRVVSRTRRRGFSGRVGLDAHGELAVVVFGFLVVVWAFSGGGAFWPVWIALAFAATLGVHAIVLKREQSASEEREGELTERVDELRRSRSSAMEAEAVQLRRIERDLHDGAQARLVALTIQLGRAEERAAEQPELAQLIGEAKSEAGAAIRELRDLSRGIAPPILADRGLVAAVDAVARRSPLPVVVDAPGVPRYGPAVENAAYFVVSEALTNVAKHAVASRAHVLVRGDAELLTVEVEDDGQGGADPSGSGLDGLRRRVEALDGTLVVTPRPGGGTILTARLPCGS